MSDPKATAREGDETVKKQQQTRAQDEADVLDKGKDTMLDAFAGMLAGIQRSKQARESAGERRARTRSKGNDDGPPRAEIGSATTAGDMLFEFARLQVDILEKVLSFQRKHSDRMFERLSGGADASTGAGAAQPVILTQHTPGPHPALGKFVVENMGTKTTHVSFRLTQLRSRDGEAPFTPKATFHLDGEQAPVTDLVLEPDEERSVGIHVDTDPRFKAGKRYRGHIVISMPGRPKIELPLRVDIQRDSAAASAKSSSK